MRRRKLLKPVAWIAGLLLIGELIARFVLGLGDQALYITDKDFEYIQAPNQDVTRFGNRIQTNSFSMRSKPLSDADRLRILKFGDSIINGGNHVDQDSLASTRIEKRLRATYQDSISVLNVSANSWGPDNAAAYLHKYGDFNAAIMVVVFSSHDYHDNMHHREVVGVHRSWPKEKPNSALTDGFMNYAWPKVRGWFSDYNEYAYLDGFDDSAVNPGWEALIAHAREHDMELFVFLHPELQESEDKAYNKSGREVIKMLKAMEVDPILAIDAGYTAADYHDHIHLNESGHRKMAQFIHNHINEAVGGRLPGR